MIRYDLKPDSETPCTLDIGCGNTAEDADVLMDIDPYVETKGKQFYCHDANNVPYPFPNSTFDYIYLNNILEHLTIPDHVVFRELFRILKTFGKVEIHSPNSLFIYHRFLYFIGIVPCDFILCHRKHYSFKQMKFNLRNAGFKVFELENRWLFNPFRNYTNPHIRIIAKKPDSEV